MSDQKIKQRNEKERDPIKSMNRKNRIWGALNSRFDKNSMDEKDQEDILDWACFNIPSEKLFYLFDKIKHERLQK